MAADVVNGLIAGGLSQTSSPMRSSARRHTLHNRFALNAAPLATIPWRGRVCRRPAGGGFFVEYADGPGQKLRKIMIVDNGERQRRARPIHLV
jgi:hypothetical protein